MPDAKTINKDVEAYFDRNSQYRMVIINESPFHSLGYRAKKADVTAVIREHLAGLADPAMCDIGCNDGTFLTGLIQGGMRARFSGVDVSAKALDIARGDPQLAGVSLLKSDDESIPLPDGSQDVVTLIEVLEHVDHKERLLAEIHRILRPGGICVLTTPNPSCVSLRVQDTIVRTLRAAFGRSDHKDIFIDIDSLAATARRVGLAMDSSRPFYWLRPYITLSYHRATVGFLLPVPLPMPPSWLVWYQNLLNRRFGRFHPGGIIGRHACWSLFTVLRRP